MVNGVKMDERIYLGEIEKMEDYKKYTQPILHDSYTSLLPPDALTSQVPASQDDKYSFCSSVKVSILIPIAFNFILAIISSISVGTP